MSSIFDSLTSLTLLNPKPACHRSEHEGEDGETYYQAILDEAVVGCVAVAEGLDGKAVLQDLVVIESSMAREIVEGLLICAVFHLMRQGVRELLIEVGWLEEVPGGVRWRDRIRRDVAERLMLRV